MRKQVSRHPSSRQPTSSDTAKNTVPLLAAYLSLQELHTALIAMFIAIDKSQNRAFAKALGTEFDAHDVKPDFMARASRTLRRLAKAIRAASKPPRAKPSVSRH